MTMDRTTRVERVLPDLFTELADARTPAYLEAAIERASSRSQRPAWTFPGRWLPMQLTTEAVPIARGPWRLIGALALIGALIAVAMVAQVGSRPTQSTLRAPAFGPAGTGLIALAKDGDILVADRPGGDFRPLVVGPENDGSPFFSPDGTKLAFSRSIDARPGECGLMLADADGTNVVQLTRRPDDCGYWWSFAPDGRTFLTVDTIDGVRRVVVHPVDPEAGPVVLDIPLPRGEGAPPPRFRPGDPGEILVVAPLAPEGPRGIYVVDVATSGIRTRVGPADPGYVDDVEWSPTGDRISYDLMDGTSHLAHIVAADGSGDRILVDAPGTSTAERVSPWSNDGTRMVLSRGRGGEEGEFVVNTSGEGKPVELACGPGRAISCSPGWIWSPDDSMLIGTTSDLTTNYQLADPDTGRVTDLDWYGFDFGYPAWQRVAPPD